MEKAPSYFGTPRTVTAGALDADVGAVNAPSDTGEVFYLVELMHYAAVLLGCGKMHELSEEMRRNQAGHFFDCAAQRRLRHVKGSVRIEPQRQQHLQ